MAQIVESMTDVSRVAVADDDGGRGAFTLANGYEPGRDPHSVRGLEHEILETHARTGRVQGVFLIGEVEHARLHEKNQRHEQEVGEKWKTREFPDAGE